MRLCTQPPNSARANPHTPIPPRAPGAYSLRRPELESRLAVGHPQGPGGLGLDPSENGATSPGRSRDRGHRYLCPSTDSGHNHTQVASTMIDNKTATTTVFISRPSTLCTLTIRRIELVTTVVSVVPNVAEQPIAR